MNALAETTRLKSLITTYQNRWLDEVENENDLAYQTILLKVGQTVDGVVEPVEADAIEFGTLRGAVYEALNRYNPEVSKKSRKRLQRTICIVYGGVVPPDQVSWNPSYYDLLNTVPEELRQIAGAIWDWANSRQFIN
ncbi:hypothetical protein TWF718_001537 [Orbilia javanica]|uniref:Uncharacterized protein n=1 Tax=Orbilia javanica TaxID=47235 RepID=A0AAN8N1G3_9PEZI